MSGLRNLVRSLGSSGFSSLISAVSMGVCTHTHMHADPRHEALLTSMYMPVYMCVCALRSPSQM